MTTPRDLFLVSMDMPSDRPVERGDLSLALAGAEVIDLLNARAVRLEDDHLVPDDPPHDTPAMTDRLLGEAASSLVRQAPYETVSDWLWRRGRGLAAVYLAELEAQGQITSQQRRRWMVLRTSRTVLTDSPARRQAANRWAADEPVLAALAAAVGIHGGIHDAPTEEAPGVLDDTVERVLTEVEDAVGELVAERQRRVRRREEAAEDNRQRGY
ncbi:GPP34 family phosphoprotein [Streptomyces sp. NPDC056909]|uniref:GOLPH3/VPS74 family protein n=1 Tax=Streptomyces sp. NPDC056909 TaxID=3345963 RepID=UPI0036A8E7A5